MSASVSGHTEAVNELLAAGANLHSKHTRYFGREARSDLGGMGCIPTIRTTGFGPAAGCAMWFFVVVMHERLTALHGASKRGNTETVMALVAAGVDVCCQDDDGYGRCFASRRHT